MTEHSETTLLQEPPDIPLSEGEDYSDDHRPIGWVTVATFFNPEDAHIARLQLDSENIPCYISGEYITGTLWYYALATGGAKVKVPAASAHDAAAALAGTLKPASAELVNHAGLCPRCGSTQIRRGAMKRRVLCLLLLVVPSMAINPLVIVAILVGGVALIFATRTSACDECGFEWSGSSGQGFEVLQSAGQPATDEGHEHSQ